MLAGGALSVLCWTDSLLAQGDGAAGPDAGAGEGAGGSNVVVTQSFPWLGLFVTLILAGLCLFAVCRSSRRN